MANEFDQAVKHKPAKQSKLKPELAFTTYALALLACAFAALGGSILINQNNNLSLIVGIVLILMVSVAIIFLVRKGINTITAEFKDK